jgi:hypothetical protein
MDVNEEYIQEQKENERIWREKISSYCQECLLEQRRFIPSDIFLSSQTQLMHERGMSAVLAKRLMTKKCLWLIRMSEYYISKLHYAELHGKYSVEGNNLDIVETLAIYASVPVKFPNDGNGKKAMWRKSLEDSVKKLIMGKENNKLTASQMRNSAYKNYVGSFVDDELYNPDTLKSVDEESMSMSSRCVSRSIAVGKDEINSPIHNLLAAAASLETMQSTDITSTKELEEKSKKIKSQLVSVLSRGTNENQSSKL